jgi:hypothetical protein
LVYSPWGEASSHHTPFTSSPPKTPLLFVPCPALLPVPPHTHPFLAPLLRPSHAPLPSLSLPPPPSLSPLPLSLPLPSRFPSTISLFPLPPSSSPFPNPTPPFYFLLPQAGSNTYLQPSRQRARQICENQTLWRRQEGGGGSERKGRMYQRGRPRDTIRREGERDGEGGKKAEGGMVRRSRERGR